MIIFSIMPIIFLICVMILILFHVINTVSQKTFNINIYNTKLVNIMMNILGIIMMTTSILFLFGLYLQLGRAIYQFFYSISFNFMNSSISSYLALTITLMGFSYFAKKIFSGVAFFLNIFSKRKHGDTVGYALNRLSEFLRIKILIYGAVFIMTILSTINTLDNSSSTFFGIDNLVILQSVVSFVALDSFLSSLKPELPAIKHDFNKFKELFNTKNNTTDENIV